MSIVCVGGGILNQSLPLVLRLQQGGNAIILKHMGILAVNETHKGTGFGPAEWL